MVFADVGRKLLKMITARIGNLLVELGDFFLLFLPVFAEPHHALKVPLHFGELVLGAAKGIDRKIDLAVREGGGLLHARIKANLPARFRMHRSLDLTLGEDRGVPAVRLAHYRDAPKLPIDEAAAAVA